MQRLVLMPRALRLRHHEVLAGAERARARRGHQVPAGSLPRTMEVVLRNEQVEQARAGDKLVFSGNLVVVPDIAMLTIPGERVQVGRRGARPIPTPTSPCSQLSADAALEGHASCQQGMLAVQEVAAVQPVRERDHGAGGGGRDACACRRGRGGGRRGGDHGHQGPGQPRAHLPPLLHGLLGAGAAAWAAPRRAPATPHRQCAVHRWSPSAKSLPNPLLHSSVRRAQQLPTVNKAHQGGKDLWRSTPQER